MKKAYGETTNERVYPCSHFMKRTLPILALALLLAAPFWPGTAEAIRATIGTAKSQAKDKTPERFRAAREAKARNRAEARAKAKARAEAAPQSGEGQK